MTDALIIIDMQQGAFGEGPPKHDAAGLIDRLNRLAAAVRARGGAVVFIQHDGPPGDPFHPDQPGWKLVEDLERHPADPVIAKKSCDAFLETALEEFLHRRAIDRLIITGWATDYCVDTTVRSALARGWPTIVPSDGHTAANRPHLPAEKIIAHHNAI
jgi:nicotinamidase-related amidase